jgi:ABC-type cobalamin/Fe3+-siderophores transport system ATPase subunit
LRITNVRASNLLSFETLELSLAESAPTILAGPNGAGKTNVYRLIRHLITGVHHYNAGSPGGWNEVLTSWKRNVHEDCSIEIDVDWTHPLEHELIGGYFQMVLANPEEMARALGNPNQPVSDWPGWASFVVALKDQLPADIVGQHWCGTLGCRQGVSEATLLYFRPKVSGGLWEYALTLPYGITDSHFSNLNSYASSSLSTLWIASTPENIRHEINTALREIQGEPFPLRTSWSELWESVRLARSSTSKRIVVEAKVSSNEHGKLQPYWQHVLDQLGIQLDGRVYPTFLTVLSRLLRSCVISEDLLSPPNQDYSPATLKQYGESTQSQHLAARLFTLKNGSDKERNTFTRIQLMFHELSGREIDVSIEFIGGRPQEAERQTVMRLPGSQEHQVGVEWNSADDSDPVTLRVMLVQRGSNDTRSIPLTESGAGLVEIAYVSSVLNSQDTHVVLLDEPGRSLHPHAILRSRHLLQRELKRQSAAQVVIITHSPYLIPASTPSAVRRLSWDADTGTTQINTIDNTNVSPDKRKEREEAEQQAFARQDRWGRSPNWPSLLFSAVVLLVDGETELGALPEWYERVYGQPMEAIGASIMSIGGKTNGGTNILDLQLLRIPWVMLIDGDSLKTGKNNTGNIWSQLEKAGLIDNDEANRRRAMSIEVQKLLLNQQNIFVMGRCEEDRFESVLETENPEKKPPKLNDSKVLKGRWWAQNAECPGVVQQMFQAVLRRANHGVNQ